VNRATRRSAVPIRTVSIVPNPDKPRARQELPRLKKWLRGRGIGVAGPSSVSRSDAVITLGGDGTILSVAASAAAAGVPVLGVNLGRLGFMTSVDVRRLYPALTRWLAGEWIVSERLMLEVTPPRAKPCFALNDAVIRIGSTARLTMISAAVSGENLGDFTGDGVIVATPTGSTAYSLAAQGPIVHPEMEAIVITPICAHSFRQRPVVIPAGRNVQLTLDDVRERGETQLCVDGQQVYKLRFGDHVGISRSPFKLKLLQDPRSSYFGVLREKLSWGGR
jgi:NAD+ kinase